MVFILNEIKFKLYYFKSMIFKAKKEKVRVSNDVNLTTVVQGQKWKQVQVCLLDVVTRIKLVSFLP